MEITKERTEDTKRKEEKRHCEVITSEIELLLASNQYQIDKIMNEFSRKRCGKVDAKKQRRTKHHFTHNKEECDRNKKNGLVCAINLVRVAKNQEQSSCERIRHCQIRYGL